MHLCNKLEYMQTTHSKYTHSTTSRCVQCSVLWCCIFTIIRTLAVTNPIAAFVTTRIQFRNCWSNHSCNQSVSTREYNYTDNSVMATWHDAGRRTIKGRGGWTHVTTCHLSRRNVHMTKKFHCRTDSGIRREEFEHRRAN